MLAVDDKRANLLALEAVLGSSYDLVLAETGREAIETVKARHDIDLVLMDVQMPIMDGFEATAAIRRLDGATGSVAIVALTANALDGDREKCLAAGMNDFLPKPIRKDALEAALKAWLPGERRAATTDHAA